jgi:hypothetical protein
MTAPADARVCPHCGEPPGDGVFCAACGRNLASVDRLPSRAEWEVAGAQDDRPLAERCEEATAAFLAAMHAAGDPGTTKTKMAGGSGFRRPKQVEGWTVRAVERDDHLPPQRYESGLVLSVEGTFHQLDNVARGYGTRDFPTWEHTVAPEPVAMPVQARLIAELGTVLAAHGLDSGEQPLPSRP